MSSAKAESTAKVTLFFILGSESVFFGMLVSAYLFLRTSATNWPTIQHSLQRMLVPGGNTLLLLLSALTAFLGYRAIRNSDTKGLIRWLAITMLLGLVFVGGQVLEFTRNGMSPSDHAAGGVFFALMGFHALHVTAGMVVLGLVWMRARLADFNARQHLAVDMGTYFWWYVTVVWVVLFTILYLV
jgi:cytochrome c oxidase subunit 3